MSLILDALNRSRRDAETVPGLDTTHDVAAQGDGLRRFLPWAGLAIALVVIAWLLVDRDEVAVAPVAPVAELSDNVSSALTSVKDELKARAQQQSVSVQQPDEQQPPVQPATAKPAAAAAPPEPVQVPAATAAPQGGATGPSADLAGDQAASEIAALYAKSAQEDAASTTATQQTVAAEPEPEPVPEPAPKPAPEPAADSSEEPVDLEQILLQAQNEVENAQLVEHPAPFLADLSQNTKNDIPTIFYRQHDYSDTKGRSSVVLNGKTVRAGGDAGAGIKVDEILPDSVVLNYRGTQFRLRALNSWVNL